MSIGAEDWGKLTKNEIEQIKNELKERVDCFSKILGISYGKITVRNQKNSVANNKYLIQ